MEPEELNDNVNQTNNEESINHNPQQWVQPESTLPQFVEPTEKHLNPILSGPPLENTNPIAPIQTPSTQQSEIINNQYFAPNPVMNEPVINNPVISDNPVTTDPIVPSPKKIKKGMIIGIIVAAFIVIVGGGSALAYNLWYNAPEKVITDAVMNVITAKTAIYTGTINSESGNSKITVDVTAKQANLAGSVDAKLSVNMNNNTYNATGSGVFDNAGDLYIKVNTDSIISILKNLLTTVGSENNTLSTAIDTLANKINDKWIKIGSSDLATFNQSYADNKNCLNDVTNKFRNDNSAIAEIAELYKTNPFIKVNQNLGSKDGSVGYEISIDNTKGNSFTKSIKNTKIYKSIQSCDDSSIIDDSLSSIIDSISSNESSNNSVPAPKIDLWVDSWSHQITKIDMNSSNDDSKFSTVILPKFNQTVEITTPTNSISLTELMADIQSSISEITNSISTNSSDVFNDSDPGYDIPAPTCEDILVDGESVTNCQI